LRAKFRQALRPFQVFRSWCALARTVTLDVNNVLRYGVCVIKSFRDKETSKVFHRELSSRLPNDIQRTAMRELWLLDAAETLEELRLPPSNKLEKLHGSRQGQCSIRINDQWRICFRWERGDAFEVAITDYH